MCGKISLSFLGGWGWGANEPHFSTGVRVQLERLSHPTRVINVASQQGSPCVVCVCVYSIIGPAGDGGSCSHKPTWNFLNKGLIFTGSCTVLEGVSSLSLINFTYRLTPSNLSHQCYSVTLRQEVCTMGPKVCGHHYTL